MSDGNGQPETTTDPVLRALEQRIAEAMAGFTELNRTLRDGQPPFGPSPDINALATIDAISRVLIDKHLMTEQELLHAKGHRLAELMEASLAAARDLKRQQSGLVVPGAQPPPQ